MTPQQTYLQILPPKQGSAFSSFNLYLKADMKSDVSDPFYVQYRFCYEVNPIDSTLRYSEGSNNSSNRAFYRIREAYVGKLDGEIFWPHFRVLQGGEIGFAFREEGAGDFVGGFHGDEILLEAMLTVDGKAVALNRPYFGSFSCLEFCENSHMFRCNTPSEPLVLHKQTYTVSGNTIELLQHIEWIADSKPLNAAYSPMLTIQRLDPQKTERILTDTVEFYDWKGNLIRVFDTTPYGLGGEGKYSDHVCKNTPATAVKVYGKQSGLIAEVGYNVIDDTIPNEQISTFLCIRYKKILDNKIYFGIGSAQPKRGTVWKSNIYYRIMYHPN